MRRDGFNIPNLPHEISTITITAGQECKQNVRFNWPRLENDILKT